MSHPMEEYEYLWDIASNVLKSQWYSGSYTKWCRSWKYSIKTLNYLNYRYALFLYICIPYFNVLYNVPKKVHTFISLKPAEKKSLGEHLSIPCETFDAFNQPIQKWNYKRIKLADLYSETFATAVG